MKKSLVFLLMLLVLSVLTGQSCAETADEKPQPAAELSPEEQNRKALELFQKVLEISEVEDRQKVLPDIEAVYREIITTCPRAPLAQEVYWQLIQLYVKEYRPPAFDKAEKLLAEFLAKYPESRLIDLINRAIADGYYKSSRWEKLISFLAPSIKKSIETGKFDRLNDLFLFTEAKFNLADLAEAEKGYRIIQANFPGTKESRLAVRRLEEIEQKKPKKTIPDK